MSTSTPAPTHVVYVRSLNERTNLKIMRKSLSVLFHEFGKVLDINMSSSLRMRGQAFVTMASIQSAKDAVHDLARFPLYGKPMVVDFAKSESFVYLRRKNASAIPDLVASQKAKHSRMSFRLTKDPVRASAHKPRSSKPKQESLPDEYQPPNKVLFVTQLNISKDDAERAFEKFSNFVEFRSIPGRPDIAFVEYTDDESAAAVRHALHNTLLGESQVKVNFAKR